MKIIKARIRDAAYNIGDDKKTILPSETRKLNWTEAGLEIVDETEGVALMPASNVVCVWFDSKPASAPPQQGRNKGRR